MNSIKNDFHNNYFLRGILYGWISVIISLSIMHQIVVNIEFLFEIIFFSICIIILEKEPFKNMKGYNND